MSSGRERYENWAPRLNPLQLNKKMDRFHGVNFAPLLRRIEPRWNKGNKDFIPVK